MQWHALCRARKWRQCDVFLIADANVSESVRNETDAATEREPKTKDRGTTKTHTKEQEQIRRCGAEVALRLLGIRVCVCSHV